RARGARLGRTAATLWRAGLLRPDSAPEKGMTAVDGVARKLPGRGERLRCAACGNLTRFDVVTRRRTAAYWHYSLAGELSIESEQDLEDRKSTRLHSSHTVIS